MEILLQLQNQAIHTTCSVDHFFYIIIFNLRISQVLRNIIH